MANIGIQQASEILGKSPRHLRRLCNDGQIKGAVKEGSRWMIPPDYDARLFCKPADRTSADSLSNISAGKKNVALKRLGFLKQFEQFDKSNTHITKTEAIAYFCSQNNINRATFYRWQKEYRTTGIVGLVDTRGGVVTAETLSPEAAHMFKSLWLNEKQPSVKQIWMIIHKLNQDNEAGWQIPSLRSMYNWIDKNIPLPTQILHREGKEAYEAKCAPYIQKDITTIMPNQCWVGDHHMFNCWVTHRGQWVRPWLTAWADMRSRTLVGWHVNTGGNQTTIMRALRRGIENYGPPEMVKIDNGKDYDSEMWTGITKAKRRKAIKAGYIDETMATGLYGMLGIAASFAIPYHPQSKPVERFFHTADIQFTKTFDTYCGKDHARRPDDLMGKLKNEFYKEHKSITLDEFAELFDKYAPIFNASAHTGIGMHGDSPDQVMARRLHQRYVDPDVMDMLLCVWSGEQKVGKNGVNFKRLLYGQYEPELLRHFGKPVRIAYNPDDLRQISVYDASNMQLLCNAQQNQLMQYGEAVDEEALREAMAKKNRAIKSIKLSTDYRRTAAMDITALTMEAMIDAQNPAPPKQTLNIQPIAQQMRHAARAKKLLDMQPMKKAVGAEGINLNLGNIKTKKNQRTLGLLK